VFLYRTKTFLMGSLQSPMTVECPGQYKVDDTIVILDEECFMQNPENWNEKVAEWLAKELEGIQKMTEDHWKIIKYVRKYWETYGVSPPVKMVMKETGFTLEQIYQLFPSGPVKGAYKVAGVPKPTGCISI